LAFSSWHRQPAYTRSDENPFKTERGKFAATFSITRTSHADSASDRFVRASAPLPKINTQSLVQGLLAQPLRERSGEGLCVESKNLTFRSTRSAISVRLGVWFLDAVDAAEKQDQAPGQCALDSVTAAFNRGLNPS
jgi:hypothetical protein